MNVGVTTVTSNQHVLLGIFEWVKNVHFVF